MAKKIISSFKLEIPAGSAKPSPPVGPALGQRGLNIMEFCKAFNTLTEKMENGMPVPVVITAYADRTFTFVTKTPPVSYFLKRALSLTKGSQTPGRSAFAEISLTQIEEIAAIKMPDLNAIDIRGAVKMIKGSARSIGIKVVE
ncbi:50S ribosomal protein L11 [Candidatus Endolissoclinum faulkneri]|nr:50S ribosomal protein L11 [Candidatus Endolissoclinum faulkneri]